MLERFEEFFLMTKPGPRSGKRSAAARERGRKKNEVIAFPSLDYGLVLKPVEQGDRAPIMIAWIGRSALRFRNRTGNWHALEA